jgi:hypothetical protein
MLFLLTTSSRPYSEYQIEDVGFRKVSNVMAAIFVYRKKEEADGVADAYLKGRGVHITARVVTKEELAQLQTRFSGGTVKFVFELSGPKSDTAYYHETIGTIEEGA